MMDLKGIKEVKNVSSLAWAKQEDEQAFSILERKFVLSGAFRNLAV